MTRKDLIKSLINLNNIIIAVIVGSMFAISTYNVQTMGVNLVNVLSSMVIVISIKD